MVRWCNKMSFPENWKLKISEWLQHTDVSALFLYQLIIHFLPFFFLSFFSQGWRAPGWSLWTQRGLWGWAGALNPTPSAPLIPCTLLQLPFFLCPGQEMDIIHSKEKNQLGKALWTSPTPTWRDGTAMASEMAGKLLLTWMASSPRGASAQRIPKPIKSLKIVHRRFFIFCLFFFFCFAFKGSL